MRISHREGDRLANGWTRKNFIFTERIYREITANNVDPSENENMG
jgi:hypothetical protein